MYRKNLDIALAAIVAILGGLAAAAKLPGVITIPLGFGLFFAPGYLWSEAILTQRLPGIERTMTSVGMALIFPILGGFLFYALHIPLLKPSWIGLLVVLTLMGLVAVAVQRLREAPVDPRQSQRQQQYQRPQQRKNQQARPGGGASIVHAAIFGLAAVIGIGSVAFSVKNAEAQKFPGYTMLGMTEVVAGAQSFVGNANSAGNPQAMATSATQAHLNVTNHQGVPEQYRLTLLKKGKVTNTWNITLNDGQTWQQTIAYTLAYKMVADLYLLPNTTAVYRTVDNGQ
jgi:Protein of unknown function (DUF1616)